VLLLGLGLIFLGINAGYLRHQVWHELIHLWPVLLIAVGIELIFAKSRFAFLALLSPLLIALGFLYAVLQSDGWSSRWSYGSRENTGLQVYTYLLEQDPDIKSLEIELDFGPGELWVGPTSDKLLSGDFEYRYRKPRIDYDTQNDKGSLTISAGDHPRLGVFRHGDFHNDARLFIGDYLPLSLDLDVGASEVDLDLSALDLKELHLDTGAAQIRLKLGCKSEATNIEINAGASEVNLMVPRDMGLKLETDVVLSSTNLDDIGLVKTDGQFRSENYDAATCRAQINIDSGVSEIEISYY